MSVLAWIVFGIEEWGRHHFGSSTRELTDASTVIAAATAALIFPFVAWCCMSSKSRLVRIVVGLVLLVGILLWVPNPWENM